jgi:hypothetical protein
MANKKQTKKQTAFEKNMDEIKWNLINSCLIGLVAFLSSLLSLGEFSFKSIAIGFITFLLITATKFKNYWETQEKEYSWTTKVFNIL